jgi:hypothetical protein
LWNGSEEVGNIRSECEEDEGIDYEGRWRQWKRLVKVGRIQHALCIN